MEPKEEVRRILRGLRRAIDDQGRTYTSLDRALGKGDKYTTRLLGGSTSLRFEVLLAYLQELGERPEQFFCRVYNLQPGRDSEEETLRPLIREETRKEFNRAFRDLLKSREVELEESEDPSEGERRREHG